MAKLEPDKKPVEHQEQVELIYESAGLNGVIA